ncbi:MAG: Gfo/Idh/MocA family oxidoreductase [Opitutae bacterium]|jgi:UDP-N-acetyl-2-amino-2-deoxyglucuronate dehydrogenase|nr:Gfo/Idh/MocA family oxidoreductase [Opitutae bacterium]
MTTKSFKIGIIGAGVIADFHAQAIQGMEGAELVAAFARNDDKARVFAEKYGCTDYSDINSFLQHPEMEVVTIASVSGAHLEHASSAAKAGKHIICEKPLEVTTDRIDQMIEVCAENNVSLSGIFPRRFNDSTYIFKKAIEGGRLGKIILCDTAIKWWRSQEYYDSGAWRGTWDLDGGGALMNQSIHTIDLMLYLLGDVTSVTASGGLEAHEGIEVEDVAVAIVEFKSGARGVIQASTACYSNTGLPASIHICGDQGSIMMVDDKFSVWDLKHHQAEDEKILAQHGVYENTSGAGAADPKAIDFVWHQRNFENALDALRNNKKPEVDGKEGRRAVELITAIYQSIQNGGTRVSL